MTLKELTSIIDENQQIRIYLKDVVCTMCKGKMYNRELTEFFLNMKVITVNKQGDVINVFLESEVK